MKISNLFEEIKVLWLPRTHFIDPNITKATQNIKVNRSIVPALISKWMAKKSLPNLEEK